MEPRHRFSSAFLALSAMVLISCADMNVAPAIQTSSARGLKMTGLEKFAVLPLNIIGYPLDDVPAVSQRMSSFVEVAFQREDFKVIPQYTYEDTLKRLKFDPPEDYDIPSAQLLRKITKADIVIEGTLSTVVVGIVNTFKETLYAIDARSGHLIAMTTGEGDSEITVNCARELARRIKRTVPELPAPTTSSTQPN